MAKVAGSLFLVALCLCKSLAVGTKVPSFEAIPPNAWKEAFEGFAKLQKEQTTKSNRFLQETTTLFPQRAPTRSCGEIIGTATRDDVVAVASQMLQSLFPDGTQLAVFRPTALNLLTTTARFGFQAQVVCGSCSEIEQLYSGNSLLSNSNPNGWQTYCAPGRFGANETHSGLLLVPYDNLNGRTIEGTFKAYVGHHGTTFDQQAIPSQFFPSDFVNVFDGWNATTALLQQRVFNLYSIWPGMMAVSSGAVAILPDYLGLGHAYQHKRGYVTRQAYQQADAVLWLKTTNLLPQSTNGCTVLSPQATLGGYSEGGFAAFAGALALKEIGVNIINVPIGAPPLDLNFNIGWGIDRSERFNATIVVQILSGFVGYTFSSTNPDQVNSNIGQDVANADYLQPMNATRNVRVWLDGSPSASELLALIPPNANDLLNPTFRNESLAATAQGTPYCASTTPGVTDKLCEAILQNTLREEVIATTFPVTSCHSPEDDTIAFQNTPDPALNPNLSLFSLFGNSPTGNHNTASFFCLFSFIIPFTSINTIGDTNTIDPLANPSACVIPMPTPAPTTASPTVSSAPTMGPTTSAPTVVTTPVPTPAPPTSAASTASVLLAIVLVCAGVTQV